METRRLMLLAWISGILFASAAETQPDCSVSVTDDPDRVITSLQQVAYDLTNATKLFQTHLDQEIGLHDHGYRTSGGRRIPGADVDLIGPDGYAQAPCRTDDCRAQAGL